MEPIWSSTLILSSNHFSVSNLFPLMTILSPRYLERETTMHSSFPMLAKIMLDDLKKRFSWLYNETYYQLLTCLYPGYYVIFSKPPLSARNNQMKELLATEYATWVVESNNYISQDMVSVSFPPLISESLKILQLKAGLPFSLMNETTQKNQCQPQFPGRKVYTDPIVIRGIL